jgi:hypothetical protein
MILSCPLVGGRSKNCQHNAFFLLYLLLLPLLLLLRMTRYLSKKASKLLMVMMEDQSCESGTRHAQPLLLSMNNSNSKPLRGRQGLILG